MNTENGYRFEDIRGLCDFYPLVCRLALRPEIQGRHKEVLRGAAQYLTDLRNTVKPPTSNEERGDIMELARKCIDDLDISNNAEDKALFHCLLRVIPEEAYLKQLEAK